MIVAAVVTPTNRHLFQKSIINVMDVNTDLITSECLVSTLNKEVNTDLIARECLVSTLNKDVNTDLIARECLVSTLNKVVNTD